MMGRRGCRENLRRGKTRWESEKELVSIGKRNTFLVHQHGVSSPSLYMIYIQILIQIICDSSIGEGKGREERRGGGGGEGEGEGEREREREKEVPSSNVFNSCSVSLVFTMNQILRTPAELQLALAHCY